MPKQTHVPLRVVKVPLDRTVRTNFRKDFPRMSRLYLEMIENTSKIVPKYIGKELGIFNCLCCNESEISKSEFHAGHYISEVNGGKTNKENLRPICAGCNLSMGKKNMDEYMNQYYKIENN